MTLPKTPIHWNSDQEGISPLGHSSDQLLQDCPAKFNYHVNRGLVAPSSPAQIIGSAIHAALAVYHGLAKPAGTKKKVERSKQALYEALAYLNTNALAHCNDEEEQADIERMVTKTLTAYFAEYPEDKDPWTVVAVEQPFDLELFPGVRSTGRLDGIIIKDGQVLVLEHKTTSYSLNRFYEECIPRGQITRYCHAASLVLGKPVRGVLLNVLVKSKAEKPRTEKFGRYILTCTDQEIRHLETKLKAVRAIKDLYTSQGVWPTNEARCHDYFHLCPYWHICQGGGETTTNMAEFTKETHHAD